MKLNYFKEIKFLPAIKALLKELQVPVNYISNEPTTAQEILSPITYKDNETFRLIKDVYFVGMVDDAAFEGNSSFDHTKIKSDYDGILFFGLELSNRENNLLPTRTQLADIARAFNREFHFTPVVVVFKYADNKEEYIAFANVERTKYKQEWRESEKAGKVALLRDISIERPHRGHEDIINQLKITTSGTKAIRSFDALYQYWQEVFNVNILNKKFYEELSNWYFWAIKNVTFPSEPTLDDVIRKYGTADHDKLAELINEHNATNVIRLLTRLLFTWFIKEKKLIPETLFDLDALQTDILKDINPYQQDGMFKNANMDSIYYKAILQNLFFASLNCPIEADSVDKRKRGFRELTTADGKEARGKHFAIDWMMRYEDYFMNPDSFLNLLNSTVPFLNGGLFECLDDKPNKVLIDGFSDNEANKKKLIVPDFLFFGLDTEVDLSQDYGSKNKKHKKAAVKGLINILKSYKFTINENTPIEEDVALDPELLGKVFENLLASYNPETKSTARKQTGSFYTPREIVNYMVDESLIAYLKTKILQEDEGVFVEIGEIQTNLFGNKGKSGQLNFQINPTSSVFENNEKILDDLLHQLVSYDPGNPFEGYPQTTGRILNHLDKCKILDPACGSGAFPMGILQKMVHILQKLDPNNEEWKKVQLDNAIKASKEAYIIEDKQERENKLIEINNAFDSNINDPDYARKLYLIENCIYGVDIQPIATQISKLRFFISLVVDQKNNLKANSNFGIRPLPNLETKFVTANTLIGIEKPTGQTTLSDTDTVKSLEKELKSIRHKLFGARTKDTKLKYRKKDEELRNAISVQLKKNGWHNETADKLSSWDPYDQNASASYFDSEWMFDVKDGFDVIIGNPPYKILTRNNTESNLLDHYIKEYFSIKTSSSKNLYALFIELSISLLKENSQLVFIVPEGLYKTRSYIDCVKQMNKVGSTTKVVTFSEYVFENAVTGNLIFLYQKRLDLTKRNYHFDKDYNLKELLEVDHKEINAIESSTVPLKQISMAFKGMVVKDRNEVLSSEKNTDRFLLGKNISKWNIDSWLFTDYKMLKIIGGTKKLEKHNHHPRVLVRRTGAELTCAYLKIPALTESTLYSVWSTDKKISTLFLFGILNSKLLNYYNKYKNITNKQGFPQILMSDLQELPIKLPSTKFLKFIEEVTLILDYKYDRLIDDILNALVFNLYFTDHMKEKEIDVLEYVEEDIEKVMKGREFDNLSDTKKEEGIEQLQHIWTHPDNEVRNRIKLFAVRSPDILKPILES